MSEHKVYRATVAREPGWWVVTIPELNLVTQARRLRDVQHMATDVVAVWLDVNPAALSVQVDDIAAPAAIAQQMARAEQLLAQASEEQELANRLARDAVHQLTHDLGLTLREAAEVLGIPLQRVAQLHGRTRDAA
jgi:DNA-directed RNA polymerase specialized sigma24 family protein